MTPVGELPLSSERDTKVEITVLWDTKIKMRIDNKCYTITKPKGNSSISVEEGAIYNIRKVKFGRGYRLIVANRIDKTKPKGRTHKQILQDVKDERDEFFRELESEILRRETNDKI